LTLRKVAKTVRHAPLLNHLEPVWNMIRPTYQRLLDLSGRGVPVNIGGAVIAPMPAEYTGGDWENYETAEIRGVSAWLREHPHALFVDVGCAVGIYSLAALTLGAQVLALDSDLASLKSTERMCRHAGNPSLLWGFVSERHESGITLDGLRELTARNLEESGVTGEPGTNRYVCIGEDDSVPFHALDGLLPRGISTLIKCDIEGAELFMLRGASGFIASERPYISLSVHPPALSWFGHDVTQVHEFLEKNKYTVEVLSVDHEEHWWCSPM
jgi:FkbM family methyltransferase